MSLQKLEDLTVKQLVDRFAEIGVEQAEALLYDQNKKYNRLFLDMKAINAELRRRSAQLELLNLYDHPNIQVQLQAASYSVTVAPVPARHKMNIIANARYALRAWEEYGIPDR